MLQATFRENEDICHRKQSLFSSHGEITKFVFQTIICFHLAGCLCLINFGSFVIKI